MLESQEAAMVGDATKEKTPSQKAMQQPLMPLKRTNHTRIHA